MSTEARRCFGLVVGMAGCGAHPTATPPGPRVAPGSQTASASATAPIAASAACASDGTLDFTITGSELHAFEGRLVWAVAVARADRSRPRRVVRLAGRIQGGDFSLSCPRSLEPSLAYPSWTVVIDADDDRTCSEADRQHTAQFFGWQEHVVADVTLAANGQRATWETTVAEARTAVGDHSQFDFCRYYFGNER